MRSPIIQNASHQLLRPVPVCVVRDQSSHLLPGDGVAWGWIKSLPLLRVMQTIWNSYLFKQLWGLGAQCCLREYFLSCLVLASESFMKEHFVEFPPGDGQGVCLMTSLLLGFPASVPAGVSAKHPITTKPPTLPGEVTLPLRHLALLCGGLAADALWYVSVSRVAQKPLFHSCLCAQICSDSKGKVN